MRLIDADKIVWRTQHFDKTALNIDFVFKEDIDAMPTVEAEPIRHGKWIDNGANYKCSNCGNTESYDTDCYCRVCGAKMDGKENEK